MAGVGSRARCATLSNSCPSSKPPSAAASRAWSGGRLSPEPRTSSSEAPPSIGLLPNTSFGLAQSSDEKGSNDDFDVTPDDDLGHGRQPSRVRRGGEYRLHRDHRLRSDCRERPDSSGVRRRSTAGGRPLHGQGPPLARLYGPVTPGRRDAAHGSLAPHRRDAVSPPPTQHTHDTCRAPRSPPA